MATLPRLLLTCGDPAGIGPEIVATAWRDPSLHRSAQLSVVGDVALMQRAVRETAGTALAE